jgi:hypothetical protein
MTTDEAIALIPPGWLLRLTNWQDRTSSGWAAELFHADGGRVADEADGPAEAVQLVAEEAARLLTVTVLCSNPPCTSALVSDVRSADITHPPR